MKEVKELNDLYLRYDKELALFSKSKLTFESVKRYGPNSIDKKIVSEMLDSLTSLMNCSFVSEKIKRLVRLIEGYNSYLHSIDQYEKENLSYCDKSVSETKLEAGSDSFINARHLFSELKMQYSRDFNSSVVSPVDLCNEVISVIDECEEKTKNVIKVLLDDAKKIVKYNSVTIDNDEIAECSELPRNVAVAKKYLDVRPCEILNAIGERLAYDVISIDLVKQGNLLVETAFENKLDDEIDNFVLAYVFKMLDVFPLGTINIHIYDKNPNRNNRRLHAVFKSGNSSELAQKTVTLYDYKSLSEMCDVARVVRDDIFRKTSSKYPDLYSLHELDKSDAFHLFILRDGLIESGAYSNDSVLELINSMTKPGESAHLAGIRFLIIDDYISRKSSERPTTEYLINSIYTQCDLHLEYRRDHRFYFKDNRVEVLSMKGDIDSLVEIRARHIVEKITGQLKRYVSITDVASCNKDAANESIMHIPVGKSGNSIVSIPFSCKDERGTVEGQCIGYMVIGQSGSGKSSFFHSVVLNGCLMYSPKELQFWLLDFKFGGASSKYRLSQIPHVRIVAENNKVDDAICLFQMIRDEMENRNHLINKLSVDNIIDYNNLVEDESRLPRIIILIDEVQEIFRDDNASEIQRMIASISVRMRSVGMHFVLVAQNLSEGKSYMLKEAFLPSATGRICFRIAENMPRESGFDESFVERRSEISSLSTGEAYVSWGKDTIQKVKMAYASSEDMKNHWFKTIKDKYPDCRNLSPRVIGSKKRLTLSSRLQSEEYNYSDEIKKLSENLNDSMTIIGEDSYRMMPLTIPFSSGENSSVLILGEDKLISSSICTSIALSLGRQGITVHHFNADRTKMHINGDTFAHPYMHFCSRVKELTTYNYSHRLDEFKDVLQELYDEYLMRRDLAQSNDGDSDPVFSPCFLIVNDLFEIESFANNAHISNDNKGSNVDFSMESFDFSILNSSSNVSDKNVYNEGVQEVLAQLLKNGYRYGIHTILAIKGEASTWRSIRVNDVNRLVLFNPTQYASQVENQFFVREMLKNVSNETGSETMAIWIDKKNITKFRPILIDLSNIEEMKAMESIMMRED